MTESCCEPAAATSAEAALPLDAVNDRRPAGSGAQKIAITGGILGAIGAASCCVIPFALFSVGVSGAWIGNLAVLEPYRPWFIAVALVALFFAGRRIFLKAKACSHGEVCTLPKTRRVYKAIFGIVTALVVVAIAFPYLARFFY